MKKNKGGFTLIELLVVIAILGILTTVAVVVLGNARRDARDTKRIADIKQIQKALELYNLEHGHYPISRNCGGIGALENYCYEPLTTENGVWIKDNGSDTFRIFMSNMPTDPRQIETPGTNVFSGHYYYYSYYGRGYALYFKVENIKNSILKEDGGICGRGEDWGDGSGIVMLGVDGC